MILRQTTKSLKYLRYTQKLMSNQVIRYDASTKRDQSSTDLDRQFEENNINRELSRNVGLNQFMQKVYTTTGISILAALATPYILLSMPITPDGIYFLAKAGIVSTLVGFIGTAITSPHYEARIERVSQREKIQTIIAVNPLSRQLLYGMGILGLGLSVTPFIGVMTAMNPAILPTALGLTAAIFGGASYAAYNMPKHSLLSYGRVLGGSLFGLIGLQLIGLGSQFFWGPNPFAQMLLNGSTYLSAGLFTAFVAYDTHVAVRMYEQKMPDNLGIAANFVLDFWNIFVSILKMLSDQQK